MNWNAPYLASDLEELHARLLSRADRVVPMRDIAKGDTGPRVIGLRHDVDDNSGSFGTALRLAEWEFQHGYSSTYYLLHGSHYWNEAMLERAPIFEELGHEVGIHVNAIAEGIRNHRAPDWILLEALGFLRGAGLRVDGCVAHGDALCHKARFVNDEMFVESPRPDWGEPNRVIEWKGVKVLLEPRPRNEYHLSYDANWLPRSDYISESGGRWSQPFDDVVGRFGEGQLHILIHPDWWGSAFTSEAVAA